ncbi:glycoside hydrolase family 19 protein [Deinococcus sp. HMF7620]|uniref:Glycoside hydrolase family 19 protein n=1 Tax=Deinococcus arboris TaxID=2682977 RepID=A0A7C9HTZ5_9DEIO|nr:glycoside hydrolase family 19 protein [Deinococcus arboris]MVN88973.1 glycoside hydrolase family 19 protein [Deinococcus arboris]
MNLILTPEHIRAVATNPAPNGVVHALAPVIRRFDIDQTPERLGMFLAQWGHESNFVVQSENLNYSAERLCQVWPNRFPNMAAARPYARNPQALANKVYNGRMGNRAGSNDGWTFRGRGWPQLTGRDGYRAYGRLVGLDLEGNPDLLLRPEASAAVCGAFWTHKRLRSDPRSANQMADQGDMVSVTLLINGGENGLQDRLARYRRVIPLLRDQAEALKAQQAVVFPVQTLFVNGVELPLGSATIEGDTITLPSGTHRIVKQNQVGTKLYVQTS